MKVTNENFRIVEGFRLRAGLELEVDKKFEGDCDLIGKRISEAFYKKHFKAEKPEAPAKTKDKED